MWGHPLKDLSQKNYLSFAKIKSEERPYHGQFQEFYYDPNSSYDPNSARNMKDPNQGNPYGIDCYFYSSSKRKPRFFDLILSLMYHHCKDLKS
jgi:hypothetical protein